MVARRGFLSEAQTRFYNLASRDRPFFGGKKLLRSAKETPAFAKKGGSVRPPDQFSTLEKTQAPKIRLREPKSFGQKQGSNRLAEPTKKEVATLTSSYPRRNQSSGPSRAFYFPPKSPSRERKLSPSARRFFFSCPQMRQR